MKITAILALLVAAASSTCTSTSNTDAASLSGAAVQDGPHHDADPQVVGHVAPRRAVLPRRALVPPRDTPEAPIEGGITQNPDGTPPHCWIMCFNDEMVEAYNHDTDFKVCGHLRKKKNKHFLAYRRCVKKHCSKDEKADGFEDEVKEKARTWYAHHCCPNEGPMYGFPNPIHGP